MNFFRLHLLFVFLLFSCQEEKKPVSEKNKTADSLASTPSTSEISSDTTYHLSIDGKQYALVFTHNEFMSDNREQDETITVRIVATETHDTLFTQVYDFNTVGRLDHPAPNVYWLDLLNSGGGSGFSGAIFNVCISPKPKLQKIETMTELSFWKANHSATKLIFFQAHWDMGNDDADFEAHFSEHKQSISIYTITPNAVFYEELGTTVFKYDFSGEKAPFDALREKEPELAAKIDWADFE
ncbi:MAG: hypothetical protein ACRCYO_17545 [Bacteroidia bacterium]